MKNKPFDIVIVEPFDAETLEPIHQNPIYLALCGTHKNKISLREAYEEHYLHRYDMEPNNRFMKQQLLLDKFQTSIRGLQTLENPDPVEPRNEQTRVDRVKKAFLKGQNHVLCL